jgi:cell division protein FtsL
VALIAGVLAAALIVYVALECRSIIVEYDRKAAEERDRAQMLRAMARLEAD